MKSETTISLLAAIEVIKLIEEYLTQGGTGFDAELLTEALEGLRWGDRIVIEERADQ